MFGWPHPGAFYETIKGIKAKKQADGNLGSSICLFFGAPGGFEPEAICTEGYAGCHQSHISPDPIAKRPLANTKQ